MCRSTLPEAASLPHAPVTWRVLLGSILQEGAADAVAGLHLSFAVPLRMSAGAKLKPDAICAAIRRILNVQGRVSQMWSSSAIPVYPGSVVLCAAGYNLLAAAGDRVSGPGPGLFCLLRARLVTHRLRDLCRQIALPPGLTPSSAVAV